MEDVGLQRGSGAHHIHLYPLSSYQRGIFQDIVDSLARRKRFQEQSFDYGATLDSDWAKYWVICTKPGTGKSWSALFIDFIMRTRRSVEFLSAHQSLSRLFSHLPDWSDNRNHPDNVKIILATTSTLTSLRTKWVWRWTKLRAPDFRHHGQHLQLPDCEPSSSRCHHWRQCQQQP